VTLSRRSFVSAVVASLAAVPLLKGRVRAQRLPSGAAAQQKPPAPKKQRTIWIGHSF
jgi:hypothetical protein